MRAYPLLLGETSTGKAVTLLRCFDSKVGGGSFYLRERAVFANAAIVGFHADSSDPLISRAFVAFRHVNAWFNQTGFEDDESISWPDVAVRYRRPASVQVHDADGVRVSITPHASPSKDRFAMQVQQKVYIKIEAVEPRPLSQFERMAHACQDFLSIACMSHCDVEEFSVLLAKDEKGLEETGSLHTVPIYKPSEDEKRRMPNDLLFTFATIRGRPQQTLGHWLALEESLRPVRALYLSGVYGQGYLEAKLLAMAQAVEAFHRRYYPGEYLSKSDYATRVAAPLKDAIPQGIDSSLRASLKNRLDFGNEHSFQRRLTTLFKKYNEALTSVCPSPQSFVSRIKDRRNELTHLPPEAESEEREDSSRPPYADDLLQCNFVLRVLLDLCFLEAIGFSVEEITGLAKNCEQYAKIRQTFFESGSDSAEDDAMSGLEWERVPTDPKHEGQPSVTERLKIPEGWLYRTSVVGPTQLLSVALCFVPADHSPPAEPRIGQFDR
jgi:hypothetical protein